MDTRNPKRTMTIETTATTETEQKPVEQSPEVVATDDTTTKEVAKESANDTPKTIHRPEVRKKSRSLAELKESISAKQETEPASKPFQRKKAKSSIIDLVNKLRSDASLLDSVKKAKSASDEVKKAPVKPTESASSELVPAKSIQVSGTTPAPVPSSSNSMNDIHIDFQYHCTTIRNSCGNIRIDHPRPQVVKRQRDYEDDEDEDDEDDSDYEPSDDDDEDEDDDDDDDEDDDMEYKQPIEGLPKEVFYNNFETEWIKSASDEVKKDIVERENKLAQVQSSEIPLRFRVLQSPHLSDRSKLNIIRMIDDTNDASPFGDSSKMFQRMNLLSKIPFDTYLKPPITRDQSPEEVGKYLVSVKDTMDKAVFGHNVAKQQIISILAREISNPKSVGNVFAIQGPMGNGKTTLAKEGICKAMGRPFAFISLGGMQDSAFFTGHSYTYEGSKPGRIVEILIETGCMNPVFYFDELDKVSETAHGEEIIHLLCHLTDSTQNSLFQDKYFSGIDFDLSKATFIFSYNDESRINPILLDRMIKIRTDGFDTQSKMTIAKNYLLPSLRTQFHFGDTDVVFTDEVLKHMMAEYTYDEKGVRNLKRCLDAVLSKCNILRYIPVEQQKEMGLAIKGFKLPWTLTIDNLKDFLEKDSSKELHPALSMLYL